MKPIPRLLCWSGLFLAATACSSVSPLRSGIDELAKELLAAAEKRRDLDSLKVLVYRIDPILGYQDEIAEEQHGVGIELKHELLVTLSPTLQIMEPDYLPGQSADMELVETATMLLKDLEPGEGPAQEAGAGNPPAGTGPATSLSSLQELAAKYEANAILLGNWAFVSPTRVSLSLRLVDARTNLVIGASRGVVVLDRDEGWIRLFPK
ncbi:MAG: hypothetical protein DWQ01_09610 [Planctomycetota bacterium]|nr:MAG: hypothetical protein DWQ01_09610 [Planctomycetota bacterium]